LDEEDRVVYEKRLPNDLGYLLLHLANTVAIQQYTGFKYTDDRSDALGYSASVAT
jgi:hypothetical protein